MHITFRTIDDTDMPAAFAWHRGFAAANDALFPRDRNRFMELVSDRCVWCAVSADNEYQAMSYASFSEEDNYWEIGGLMVAAAMRGKGLGRVMMRLPLAHTIFNERAEGGGPLPRFVAHVLAANQAPRRIIPQIGFVFHKKVEVPSQALPGLKADPDGMIRGDEFHLKLPESLFDLADWCNAWNGKLLDGTEASIDMISGHTLSVWADAFRDMAT